MKRRATTRHVTHILKQPNLLAKKHSRWRHGLPIVYARIWIFKGLHSDLVPSIAKDVSRRCRTWWWTVYGHNQTKDNTGRSRDLGGPSSYCYYF